MPSPARKARQAEPMTVAPIPLSWLALGAWMARNPKANWVSTAWCAARRAAAPGASLASPAMPVGAPPPAAALEPSAGSAAACCASTASCRRSFHSDTKSEGMAGGTGGHAAKGAWKVQGEGGMPSRPASRISAALLPARYPPTSDVAKQAGALVPHMAVQAVLHGCAAGQWEGAPTHRSVRVRSEMTLHEHA